MAISDTSRPRGFSALRQLIKAPAERAAKRERGEHCEMCALLLPEVHAHLVELATRRIVCACDACALLFEQTPRQSASETLARSVSEGAPAPPRTKYRRIPRRISRLLDFQLSDAQWNDLLIPINMAFFFHSTPSERVVAMYPSPAGAVESLLQLDSWTEMLAANPLLAKMEPDVEALLVNRLSLHKDSSPEYYLAPIDQCYKLVGLLRMHWRGLSGGSEVWQHMERFLAELREQSMPLKRGSGSGSFFGPLEVESQPAPTPNNVPDPLAPCDVVEELGHA